MTGDTAVGFEDGVPAAFHGVEGVGVAPEIAIEAGVRRHQGALVGGQGVQDVRRGQAPRVQRRKGRPVLGVAWSVARRAGQVVCIKAGDSSTRSVWASMVETPPSQL